MSSKKRFTLRITRSAIAFIFSCLALILISTVVAVYDYFIPKPAGGIGFWQVLHAKPELQRTGYIVDVGRGVHQVLVAR